MVEQDSPEGNNPRRRCREDERTEVQPITINKMIGAKDRGTPPSEPKNGGSAEGPSNTAHSRQDTGAIPADRRKREETLILRRN
jgi:hypothetical protein